MPLTKGQLDSTVFKPKDFPFNCFGLGIKKKLNALDVYGFEFHAFKLDFNIVLIFFCKCHTKIGRLTCRK